MVLLAKLKIILFLLLAALPLTFYPSSVFAVTVNILEAPATISDEPFAIKVSISGAQAGTNYLRANLYPKGTTSYFGYTFNGSSYYNGSDYSRYLPVTIDSTNTWSGEIQAKLDKSSPYFKGNDFYNLKVRRYTKSGSSYTWSNEVGVNIEDSTPTTTPTPQPTSQPSTASTPKTSFVISSSQTSLEQVEVLTTTVAMTGLKPNTSYFLKGAFRKPSSINYFGQTQVDTTWVKNNKSYSNQFPIESDNQGALNGSLSFLPDFEDSGFAGEGEYLFKVARYTSEGSGPAWSNELTITLPPKPTLAKTSHSPRPLNTQNSLNTLTPNSSIQIPVLGSASGSAALETKSNQLPRIKRFEAKFILLASILFLVGIALLAYVVKKRYHIFHGIFINLSKKYPEIWAKFSKKT